jgi:flagellar biosynthesis/type III secretory pathway chaperone
MEAPVIKLEDILKKELSIYEEIVGLEEQKTEAIVDRNGEQLEKLSLEQEHLLSKISRLEAERLLVIDKYRADNHLDNIAENLSLSDIIKSMDEDSTRRLMQYAMRLKKTMLAIQKIQKNNQQMIEDNLEFFNILLSGLKKSVAVQTGYSADGEAQQTISNAVLFNKTV